MEIQMDKSSIKVLVVDDEPDITKFTAKILRYDGYAALEATDGAQALDLFEKEHPQVCLLDMHLGCSKIKGMEVLESIKKSDEKVEVMVITRITDPETFDKVKKLGVKHYLLKPLAMEDWLNKLHDVTDKLL
ncbi:MAG: response regulator [Candidatus Omnitrophica bacterium]|nr:response regulator [Candidatus Omnitrophota bacterium]